VGGVSRMGATCSKDNDDNAQYIRQQRNSAPMSSARPPSELRQHLIQPGRLLKLRSTFNHLDEDHDGALSWEEYATMGRAVHGPNWDPSVVLQQFRGMVTPALALLSSLAAVPLTLCISGRR